MLSAPGSASLRCRTRSGPQRTKKQAGGALGWSALVWQRAALRAFARPPFWGPVREAHAGGRVAREWRWTNKPARELVAGLILVDPVSGCEEEITSVHVSESGMVAITVRQLGGDYAAGYSVLPATTFRTRSK